MGTHVRGILLVTLAAVATAWGGPRVTVCNRLDRLAVDDSRTDWKGATPLPNDTVGEENIAVSDVDWRAVTVAHSVSDDLLFLRYQLDKAADRVSYPAFYNVFLDVDGKRTTGYLGGAQQFPIGADYLIQGVTVFKFRGSQQTDFGWEELGVGAWSGGPDGKDIEIAVPLALLGSPASFDFIIYGDNPLSGHAADYYPDRADQGAAGDYFAYTLKEVGKGKTVVTAGSLPTAGAPPSAPPAKLKSKTSGGEP